LTRLSFTLTVVLTLTIFCHDSFSQQFDEPNETTIKKFKIKSATSWLCDDSTCKTKKHFFSWDYDRNGNLLKIFLGDKSDTSYIHKYFYDTQNRLIKMESTGDFLCNGIDNRNKYIVSTNYFYNDSNQLTTEQKKGGCCDVTIEYYYDGNQIHKKIFINKGCKYHGEVDTTLFEYSNGNLLSEINKSDDKFITYKYNIDGQLISEVYKSFYDTTRISREQKFVYENKKVITEIENETSYGFEDRQNSYNRLYNYYYDKKGLLKKIVEIHNDKVEHIHIYTYTFY